ncbi:MAG: hypothetical protein KKB20_02610 [Proteobacteria bacterium]|nr:hypothetical protein [Pseudomonadota bacterium]
MIPGTDALTSPFDVVIRSGARLTPREAEAMARLLSAAYRQGEIHSDEAGSVREDHSPEAYLDLLGEPGREVAAIREGGDLVGVLLTSAPPENSFVPLRKLSHMAFWFKPGRTIIKKRVLKAALDHFRADGLSIVCAADASARQHQALLVQAGMRPVDNHAEICWILSHLMGRTVTRIQGPGDRCRLAYVAEVRGRKIGLNRVLYCADALGDSHFGRHRAMVRRHMLLQHRRSEIDRFMSQVRCWPETGVYFMFGFSGTIVPGPENGQPDGWRVNGLGLSGPETLDHILDREHALLYLPHHRHPELQAAAEQLRPRPGFADFLLWALRMLAPVLLVSSEPRLQAAPILDRPVSELGSARISDLIETPFLTGLQLALNMTRTDADGTIRSAWRVSGGGPDRTAADLWADRGWLLAEALQLVSPVRESPLVFLGSGPEDIPAADRLAALARQGRPVLFISFGQALERHLDEIFRRMEPGRWPILGFRASSFYEAILILEILGLSPAPLMDS